MRMHRFIWLTALLLGVTIAAQAQQQTNFQYRWVDATGMPHYSDSLTVKAVHFGYDVLGVDGHVIRHVARPPTVAERKAIASSAAQSRDAKESADNTQRRDEQLLAAYPTVADFKASQQARIDQIDQRIHTTELNLSSQEQNLAELLGRAADFSRQGQHVPRELGQRITSQRKAVDTQHSLLKQQQIRRIQAQKEVAANLAHYRQLLADKQQAHDGG